MTADARAIYETIFFAEAARTHASVDPMTRDGYGPAARAVLDRGERISAEELTAAQRDRQRLTDQVDRALGSVDAVLSPTTPRVAPPLFGTRESDTVGLAPDDEFTFPANLLGLPAISVPCGLLDGLPVGLQLMSRRGSDLELAWMAVEVERIVGALPDPSARGVVRT